MFSKLGEVFAGASHPYVFLFVLFTCFTLLERPPSFPSSNMLSEWESEYELFLGRSWKA